MIDPNPHCVDYLAAFIQSTKEQSWEYRHALLLTQILDVLQQSSVTGLGAARTVLDPATGVLSLAPVDLTAKDLKGTLTTKKPLDKT